MSAAGAKPDARNRQPGTRGRATAGHQPPRGTVKGNGVFSGGAAGLDAALTELAPLLGTVGKDQLMAETEKVAPRHGVRPQQLQNAVKAWLRERERQQACEALEQRLSELLPDPADVAAAHDAIGIGAAPDGPDKHAEWWVLRFAGAKALRRMERNDLREAARQVAGAFGVKSQGLWQIAQTRAITGHRQQQAPAASGVVVDWNTLPAIMDDSVAGAMLNPLLGMARSYGGPPSCFRRDSLIPLTNAELGTLLDSHQVRTTDRRGDVVLVPAADWWRRWPGRYTVDEVLYNPEKRLAPQNKVIENSWRGLAVEPRKGSWQRMEWHLLHVICGGNKSCFDYLLRWLAHVVQHPGTSPGVMVVLKSEEEGVGKSTLALWMCQMLGQHALSSGTAAAIFGEFNASLANKSFVLIEEGAFPGNHALAAMVKNMVTNTTISLNPKGRPRYEVANTLHLMLCTNERWAIPAGVRARRFLVLDIRHPEQDLAARRRYFEALYAERDGGGVAAMLFDLLRMDLSRFNPHDVPRTAALRRQQEQGMDDVLLWARDCVANEGFVETYGVPLQGDVPNNQLHRSYQRWAEACRINRPKNLIDFCRRLTALGFVRVQAAHEVRWTVPDPMALLATTEQLGGLQ